MTDRWCSVRSQALVTASCGLQRFVWSPLGATKPCLEQVIGLHHATDPGLKPKFNQAIPLHLIATDSASQEQAAIGGAVIDSLSAPSPAASDSPVGYHN